MTTIGVALADEAVEHRAVVATDGQIPATLTEARKRLRHHRSAYQDLKDLTGRSGTETVRFSPQRGEYRRSRGGGRT